MKSVYRKVLCICLVISILVVDSCESRRSRRLRNKRMEKMLVLQRRETSPVDFSRLVAMRLIYGVASMMGVEDRLEGILGGIFVPPGADEDDYFGGFGDDDDDGDVDLGDYFDP